MTHKIRVMLNIGTYYDEVIFDVVPMGVCHLLLGHPWQYDRNAIHEGRSNTYVFRDVAIKRVLQPMGNNAIKIDHLFVHKEFLKSAQKPRTVSLKGGEDDTVTAGIFVVPPLLSSKTSSNQETRYENKMQKYVVPTLRHKKIMCATEQRGVLGVKLVYMLLKGDGHMLYRLNATTSLQIILLFARLLLRSCLGRK